MNDNVFGSADAADAPAPYRPVLHQLPVRFVGSGSEYFRIWIVNLLLTLVTVGLYYPYAKARRLRYFHGATEVGGAALSFHADPRKMLFGYLLVVLMMGAYGFAGHYSPTAGVVALIIVASLWPALWHSSMRFRLANTGWRGLRFVFTGRRMQAYTGMAVPVLLIVGLMALGAFFQPEGATTPESKDAPVKPPSAAELFTGLLPLLLAMFVMPTFLWFLKRLQHAHYALGKERTAFSASLGSFYGVTLKTLGVGLVVLALVLGAMFAIGMLTGVVKDLKGSAIALGVVSIFLIYALAFPVAVGYWTAHLQNLVWNSTASQHLRFRSDLSAALLIRLWLKNTWLVILTLGFYFPFAQVASARMRLQALTVVASINPDDLVASAGQLDEAAAGDAAGDMLGFDIGL